MTKASFLQQSDCGGIEKFELLDTPEHSLNNEDFRHLADIRGFKEVTISTSDDWDCPLTYEFIDFLNLELVQRLRFIHMPFGDELFFTLENKRQQGELKHLEYFHCSISYFTDLSFVHAISKWTSLKCLILGSENMIGDEIAHLNSLYQLEHLFLDYPGAKSDAGESLKELMSHCKIIVRDLELF